MCCKKLEEKMKGTERGGDHSEALRRSHGELHQLHKRGLQVHQERAYLDLQLDVKGCKDVYASFDKYIEVEKMDGRTNPPEDHGLQDAEKGVLFTEFPPVLQLQLKRFEYDFQRDTMVKINDRYEFPEQLDLDAGDGKYLSPDADGPCETSTCCTPCWCSGGVNGGHCCATVQICAVSGSSSTMNE